MKNKSILQCIWYNSFIQYCIVLYNLRIVQYSLHRTDIAYVVLVRTESFIILFILFTFYMYS